MENCGFHLASFLIAPASFLGQPTGFEPDPQRPLNIPADVVSLELQCRQANKPPWLNEHSLPSTGKAVCSTLRLRSFDMELEVRHVTITSFPALHHIFAQRHGAFHNLPPETLSYLDAISAPVEYQDGATLIRQGDPPHFIKLLCDGRAKITTASQEGKVLLLNIVSAGAILGLVAAVRQHRIRNDGRGIWGMRCERNCRPGFSGFSRSSSQRKLAGDADAGRRTSRSAGECASRCIIWNGRGQCREAAAGLGCDHHRK